MTQEEKYKIISDDYTDLFIAYNRNPKLLERYPGATTHIMNSRYAIAYVPSSILNVDFFKRYGDSPIPHFFGLTSEKSIEAVGINRLRSTPNLNLRGEGVLVGIIDTGIDYTNPIFIRPDGTSKIAALWDQSIDSDNQFPANTFYGTEYTREQINQALKSVNPFDIVPSKDIIGHGTMLAGIAVGSEVPASDFSGVAPDADLIIVKLKEAKNALRKFMEYPLDVPCYQENDIMWAVQYMTETAMNLNRPLSICIGLGSSQGPHNGRGPLNELLSLVGDFLKMAISISVGNEGNKRRHFYGTVDPSAGYTTAELNIGVGEQGFLIAFWGAAPDTYTVNVVSPSGESTGRIAESIQTNQQISFVFETTKLSIDNQIIGTHAGEQVIVFRFHDPNPGIWVFQVYGKGDLAGSFHMWLPNDGFISDNTYFTESNPYTTITSPGDSSIPITVTSYNPDNEVLYQGASRGYTADNSIKPELAAPGVDIIVPDLQHKFTTASGTGVAAAFTAGVAAMMLEWGVVKGFYSEISTVDIKKFLIRGAKRSKQLQYPNRDWGYGIIDVYNVFNILRTSFLK